MFKDNVKIQYLEVLETNLLSAICVSETIRFAKFIISVLGYRRQPRLTNVKISDVVFWWQQSGSSIILLCMLRGCLVPS